MSRAIPSLTHARLIARTELRRKRRALGGRSRWQLAILVLMGLFFLLPIAGATFGAYALGEGLRTGSIDLPLDLLRAGVSIVVLFVAFVAGSRTVQGSGTIDRSAGILTAVPHRDAVAGLLLTECVLFLGAATLPTLAVAVAFAVGASAPVSVVPIIVAVFALIIGGVALGYPIGLVVKFAFARSSFLARYKSIIGVLVFVAYFAVVSSNSLNSALAPVIGVLEASPIGWLVDLGFIGAPSVSANTLRAAGGIGTVLIGVPLLVGLSTVLAERLWYADPVQPSDDDDDRTSTSANGSSARGTSAGGEAPTTTSRTPPVSERVFGGVVSWPVLRIAQKNWLRARRAPLKLWYAAYPLLLVGFQIGPLLNAGQVPEWLVLYIAVCGAWMTGAAFALNPLGDEGAVLPLTLTSGVSGRTYLAGMVLPGVTPGVPITVVATVGLGVLSPLGVIEIAALAVLGAILCAGASVLAAGIGTLYPKFEESRITRNRSAVRPSIVAFLVYTIGLLAIGIPGVVAQVPVIPRALGGLGTALLSGLPDVIAQAPGLLTDLAGAIETTPSAPAIGAGVTALLAAGVAVLATRRVVRTYEGYTIDQGIQQ
jgi:ABC-2 type transport system permease protein